MKFTTLIPTTWNDGTPIDERLLNRLIDALWQPFRAMSQDGPVSGRWTDDDGAVYADKSLRIAIECDRSRLLEAMRGVLKIGRRLRQRAMYFEVSGYDGVQFLKLS